MSGRGTGQEQSAPAEQHLGDRLAAFVDGELADDARDRILAHLVTCPQCKAAAYEQRRLKSAIAATAEPTLPAALLARLQGLPGGGGDRGRGPFDGGLPGGGDVFGRGGLPDGFSYLAVGPDLLPVSDTRSRGFRVHETGRPGSASRGRRFAFAAAGAFSMAAIALGGALSMESAVNGPRAHPEEQGPVVVPMSVNAVSSDDQAGAGVRGRRFGGQDGSGPLSPSAAPEATPASVTRPLMLPHDEPIHAPAPVLTPTATPRPAVRH